MKQVPNEDLVRRWFPAFADLRDKLGMRTAVSESTPMHWFVRLEGDSFGLLIGEDRSDEMFSIRVNGSKRYWVLTTILSELGLWKNSRERADQSKLAHALEQNLPSVLRHIEGKEK